MLITFHFFETQEGDPITFDCAACGRKSVKGLPAEKVDQVRFLFLVPLAKVRATAITCAECKAVTPCKAPMATLSALSPTELAAVLRPQPTEYAPPGIKWLSVAGFVLSFVPFLGLIVAGVAFFKGWKYLGWQNLLNLVALLVGIVSAVFGLGYVLP